MELADLVLLCSLDGFGVAPHKAVIHQRRTKTILHHGLTVYLWVETWKAWGWVIFSLNSAQQKWDWATSPTYCATRTGAFLVHKILRSSCPWNLTFGYKNLINSSWSQNGHLCQIWEDVLKVLLSMRQTGPDCYGGVKMALCKSVCAAVFNESTMTNCAYSAYDSLWQQLFLHQFILESKSMFFFPTNLKKFPSRCCDTATSCHYPLQ